MNYTYDIFVSYKRYGEWTSWVRGEFSRVLDDHLSMALGRPAKIFVDDQIEAGADWPFDLSNKLTTSRVLIPLFSKMYFGSEWCLKEFYASRFKESEMGLRTPEHPAGIIVPARIHDGKLEDLPEYLHECCRIQALDLTEYAITSLKRSSLKFESFEEAVRSWVHLSVKPAIDRTLIGGPADGWLKSISEQSFACPPPANFDDLSLPSLA